jgi:dipeptidyl aminopeptidase/acylaminoacyl peptidase
MPDVREVYEMITNQKPSDPGALERQQRRQVRAARNKRIGAFAVAAVIAVVAIVVVVTTRSGTGTRTPAHQPSITPTPGPSGRAPAVSGKPFFLDVDTGELTPLPATLAGGYSYVPSPDGTKLAFDSRTGGGCTSTVGITVANLDGSGVRTITSPTGLSLCSPSWSPDGTKLVYVERDPSVETAVGNLFVEDLATGERTQLTDLLTTAWWWYLAPVATPAHGAPFSAETEPGNVIFQLPRDASKNATWDVWSVPMTGGEPTLVMRNAYFAVLRPEGPEGVRVAFVEPQPGQFEGQTLMIGRPTLTNDLRRTLAVAHQSIWWPRFSPDGSRLSYQDGGSIYVVNVATGVSTEVARGDTAEWLDDHTLIVTP